MFIQKAYLHISGIGCSSYNDSKGEKLIYKILIDNNIKLKKQKTFKDCKDKILLKFDFYLTDYNICIEFDGLQHFKPFELWGGEMEFKNIQRRDQIKNEYCSKNNIKLFRIKYDENINDRMNDIIKNLI
ncbi:MAG: hypothetical protein WDA02_06645 [Saccharofermentanales bacterium]